MPLFKKMIKQVKYALATNYLQEVNCITEHANCFRIWMIETIPKAMHKTSIYKDFILLTRVLRLKSEKNYSVR